MASSTPSRGRGSTLLRIRDLHTHFVTHEGVVKAVSGVNLEVPKGRTVCVVGESGCGKSVTALSILQLIEAPGRIVSGSISWRRDEDTAWTNLAEVDPRSEEIRRVRGGEIGMVFQEPMASLSPMYTIGHQLVEAIQLHLPRSNAEARELAITQLQRVGIPRPERQMDAYPFELSGGMCQRVMLAIALSCDPALLIADEPTTALDVTTQARILDLLMELQDQSGMAILLVTHDLGVVAEIADDVTVMYLGTVAEQGQVNDIFDNPKHPYTQALLRSIPTVGGTGRSRLPAIRGTVPHPLNRPTGCPFHTRCGHAIEGVCETAVPPTAFFGGHHHARCHLYDEAGRQAHERVDRAGPDVPRARDVPAAHATPPDPAPPVEPGPPLLRVRDLAMHFPVHSGFLNRTIAHVRAVDGVNLTIRSGETLGLVGESGCGKTTLGRCIAGILQPMRGEIHYRSADGSTTDLARLSRRQLGAYRAEIRVVFQDPFSSLNPRMTVLQLVGEPLRNCRLASGSELEDRVAAMLTRVGLRPEFLRRYPHAFSGGERQRINIARALITDPRLVIADEPVSALDVSVRAQILNLLGELQDDLDLTYIFISHDMSVVEYLCDRVAVMYLGTVVETAATATLFRTPHHPYTEALLASVPAPDPHLREARRGRAIPDDLPDPANPPPGCPFHTRCLHVRDGLCRTHVPELRETVPGHRSACHYTESLTLDGLGSRTRGRHAAGRGSGREIP